MRFNDLACELIIMFMLSNLTVARTCVIKRNGMLLRRCYYILFVFRGALSLQSFSSCFFLFLQAAFTVIFSYSFFLFTIFITLTSSTCSPWAQLYFRDRHGHWAKEKYKHIYYIHGWQETLINTSFTSLLNYFEMNSISFYIKSQSI